MSTAPDPGSRSVSCRIARERRDIAFATAPRGRSTTGCSGEGVVEQHALHLPDVRVRQPPVVVVHGRPKIDHRVAGDASGEVDVRIEIAQRERAGCGKDGAAAVQAWIARPCHRSPTPVVTVDEKHVVQLVDRLEAEDERRVAVRLERHRGEQRRLEAMRAALADYAAEAAQRGAAARLLVVGEVVQIALDGEGGPKLRDEPPLE